MILVTGSAGFIGFHVAISLLQKNNKVIGVDNLNSYYDIKLKKSRNTYLKKNFKNFFFLKLDICDGKKINYLIKKYRIKKIIHLAAQAGIRYSLKNPRAYFNSNMKGFFNILEASRLNRIDHLIYASSSSVYGANTKIPFAEKDSAQHPIQFYAATKRSNELMAHSYSSLYKLRTTGLRFFTVYGPWGRPDMAVFGFTDKLINKKKIELYNYGKNIRDFTYVEDIANGIAKILKKNWLKKKSWNSFKPEPSYSNCPFNIYNLGNNKKVSVDKLLNLLEKEVGIKGKIIKIPHQKGDVNKTWSDNKKAYKDFKYSPSTKIEDGVKKFVAWYKDFYKIK
jgi:UDP-glucuronate 4-epimerase